MRRPIHFSPDLAFPLEAVTQTFAFMAKRGAGKTYGAGKLAEEMLRANAQVVVLDPVGNWYGLRIAADGKGPGFDIPVFGGANGDIPLEPQSGRLVAKYVVERGISLILDVSRFRKGPQRQFVTDFIEELYELKKDELSAMHLFIEEAQRFCPQNVWSGGERLLGAMEDIVKLGRNYGIGVSLLSQRPQSVNKDCLNQTEVLVCLQTSGKQERKAIKDWIVEKEIDESVDLAELPSLQVGQAFVWSPSWLGILKKIQIGLKSTFNASATPKVGEKRRPPKPLAKEDLARLRDEMAEMVKSAEENDPKRLKAEIAKLKAELVKKKDHVVQAPPKVVEKVVEVPSMSLKEAEAVGKVLALSQGALRFWGDVIDGNLSRQMNDLKKALPDATRALDKVKSYKAAHTKASVAPPRAMPAPAPPRAPLREVLEETRSDASLDAGARRMLLVLGQRYALDGKSLPKRQLATMSGFQVNGGSFKTYLSRLRSGGYMEGSAELTITPRGIEYLGELPQTPKTTDEMVEMWSAKFDGKAKDMLKHLVRIYPEEVSKEELAAAVDMDVMGGSFKTYMSRLRSNGLIVAERGGPIRASESLFL